MTITDTQAATKGQRDRSPSFPFIPLKTAIERVVAFEDHHKRAPAPPDRIGPAWGMKPNTSQAAQTLAALKAYGLMETVLSSEGRRVGISDDARTYLRAQQEGVKQDVLRRAALRPRQIEKYWRDWGVDRPADAACLDQLVLRGGFSQDGADKFLRVYDATIAFAGITDSDKIPADDEVQINGDGEDDRRPEEPPKRVRLYDFKVGDYIQWASGGVDQFKIPRRVVGFLDDEHVQVFGSNTRIPVSELTVIAPPAPIKVVATTAPQKTPSPASEVLKNIDILMLGAGRLQITAEVNKAGLSVLRKMLDKYEEILDLLEMEVDPETVLTKFL